MSLSQQNTPKILDLKGYILSQNSNFKRYYGKDEDLLFRANTLRLTLVSNIPVLLFLFIFFLFPSSVEALRLQRFMFAGIIGLILAGQIACYSALMRQKFNLSRAIFMSIAFGSIFLCLLITGGFPSSMASPAIIIPVILSYCLYGGRHSLITSTLFMFALMASHFFVVMNKIDLPVMRAVPDSETILVILYAAVMCMTILMIAVLDNTYRTSLEASKVAAKCKSEFLATMSHEIRTPMNGVLGIAEVLEQTDLDEQQKEMVSIINRSGDALLKIISDILDFSKLESGKMVLEPLQTDPRTLVDDVVKMLRATSEKKGVSLAREIEGVLPLWVQADGGRILQVLINLVGNGIKFTDEGSVIIRLKSSWEKDKVRLRFEISDTGIGIPETEQAAIFEDFYQIDQSTTRLVEGTGLGLAICQKIISAMDGKMGLTSMPGQGSTFWIELDFDTFEYESVSEASPPFERNTPVDPLSSRDTKIDLVWMGSIPESLEPVLDCTNYNVTHITTNEALADYTKIRPVSGRPDPVFVITLPADIYKYTEAVKRLGQHPYLGQRPLIGISGNHSAQILLKDAFGSDTESAVNSGEPLREQFSVCLANILRDQKIAEPEAKAAA